MQYPYWTKFITCIDNIHMSLLKYFSFTVSSRIYRIAVNDIWEAQFQYNDPTLEICQGDGKQYGARIDS